LATYDLFFSLVLRHLDPERAHALAKRSLRAARATGAGRAAVRTLVGASDPCLRTRALGLTFPTPIGVAAGLDKDGTFFDDLAALGFGFVEVGTVTARPQPGNDRPRIARFPAQRALVNRMGFPNPGAEAVAQRLARRRPGSVVGVNIGKSRAVSIEDAGADYRASVRVLAPVADYLVLNVSSPNTPGLREMQAVDRLRGLIGDVRSELAAIGSAPPLLVKIDPDLDPSQLTAVTELAVELELDGLVAVNTTVDRSALGGATPFEGGGVSGRPLGDRALAVLRRIRETAGDRLVLVSAGGIENAEDAWQRIRAGATLVQVYTAFIYGGPSWPKRTNQGLAELVREARAASLQELVGDAVG
jgi:dihydroorotate dehydrogenase subfamily 2